ncbi:MAG: putative enzyme related to lactoylglutathione lyase [Salibacteraceae bacterium]|jgi:predicted enzyme related to lactoylglutathione lyase
MIDIGQQRNQYFSIFEHYYQKRQEMNKETNSLNWFEIPALDIHKSKSFYETIFKTEMDLSKNEDTEMVFFPWNPGSGKANGCVVQSPNHTPSASGSIIYLNADPSLTLIVDRVEKAGGKVMVPHMNIGEHGHIALILDTEGNQVGLHANAE